MSVVINLFFLLALPAFFVLLGRAASSEHMTHNKYVFIVLFLRNARRGRLIGFFKRE